LPTEAVQSQEDKPKFSIREKRTFGDIFGISIFEINGTPSSYEFSYYYNGGTDQQLQNDHHH
jgi:hypothetical protein